MTILTQEDVKKILLVEISRVGTRADFAKKHRIHESRISEALNGWPVRGRLLQVLGIRRERVYVLDAKEKSDG